MKLIVIIMGVLSLISGLFADKRIPKKKEIDPNSPEFKAMVRGILETKKGNIWTDKEFQAEKAYQEYLIETGRTNTK